LYNKFKFFRQNRLFYSIVIGYITFFLLFFYVHKNIQNYENRLKNILLDQSIEMLDLASSNIINNMMKKDSNLIRSNMLNTELREENIKDLSILLNDDIKSLYLLFPDKQNKLFYLLDTDKDIESRGEIGEVFNPEEGDYFYTKVIKEKIKQTFIQDQLGSLGFTLIKPIVKNNKTVALLVVDYSQKHLKSLSSLLNVSVENFKYFFLIFMILLFAFFCYVLHSAYIKYKIYHNPKTDTLNRIYLTENYEKINFASYYVGLVDIDLFMDVNINYGQENGDKVIIEIMKKINSLLDQKDLFIQYGGEEFLLLISKEKRGESQFKNLMEDVRIMVERMNFFIENKEFSLTVSIGALIHTELEKSLQDAIHKADTALYECKHNGRNRINYFDMSQTKRLYREKLKEMIDSEKLVCYYQPIRNLNTFELHHYEALLRIEDGENIIFPDKILPDLEDSYLYTNLTKRVIDYNVKKLRLDSEIKISINLSADDLINDAILAILAQNADLSNRLYIEILENKSIDYRKVELSIQKLKLFGYKICIDDFGSGYSNLNHLLNLSIDYLKIDGSIIKNIHNDKRAYSIVETFALFCQQNDIEIIAEFIDNQEVVDILKSFGVEYGQGFYFSKAKPYKDLDLNHK